MLPIYNIIVKYKEVAEVIDSKMAGYSRTGGRSSVTPDGTRRMRCLIKHLSMGIMLKFPFDRYRRGVFYTLTDRPGTEVAEAAFPTFSILTKEWDKQYEYQWNLLTSSRHDDDKYYRRKTKLAR